VLRTMTNITVTSPARFDWGTAIPRALVILVLLTCVSPVYGQTSVQPRFTATAGWTDNIDLAPPGQETSGELWQLLPGLRAGYDSSVEHATLDYQLRALFFSGGHHDIFHQGSLYSTTQLLPEWLFLDIGGQRTQGSGDPAIPVNLDYLFPANNIANFTAGTLRPGIRHVFRWARVDATFTRGFADQAQVNAPSVRSNEHDAAITVATPDAKNARFTWSTSYQRQQVDYDIVGADTFRYEAATAELGWRMTPSLQLLARGGKESDPRSGVDVGGLGSPFWAGGFDWSSGPRDELKLLVGHRFYGTSYEARWRRQTRLFALDANYTEQPASQDALLVQQNLAAPLVVFVPGTLAFTRVSADIFLDRRLYATAALVGRLTDIGVSVESEQRTYLSGAVGSDRERSVTVYLSRRLGALTEGKLLATVGQVNLLEGSLFEYTTQRYLASISRHLSRWSSVRLAAEHVQQTGQLLVFRANIVTLNFDLAVGGNPNDALAVAPLKPEHY
jgi:hypothetical protein